MGEWKYYDGFDVTAAGLNAREYLVRDGVAKLVLLWNVWESARLWRCRGGWYLPPSNQWHIHPGWDKLGAWASLRARVSKDRNGYNDLRHGDDLSEKQREKVRKNVPTKRNKDLRQGVPGALIKHEAIGPLFPEIDFDPLEDPKEIVERLASFCTWGASKRHDKLSILLSKVLLANWRGVNWVPCKSSHLEKWASTNFSDKTSCLNQTDTLAPLARIFWGADEAAGPLKTPVSRIPGIERTSQDAFNAELCLDRYQSFESGDHSPRASPLPLGTVLRWGKLLCFGPLLPDTAVEEDVEAALEPMSKLERDVWDAFWGSQGEVWGENNDHVRGHDLQTFASALNSLVKSDEAVIIPKNQRVEKWTSPAFD